MGPAERPMTYLSTEHRSSKQNMAPERRRNPLSAALDRSVLPAVIRRPAVVPVGRGHLPDIPIMTYPLGSEGISHG